MLKLKLQYFGHLMWRVDSLEIPWCWERLGAGEEGDNRGWDGWMVSPTRWTWVWVNSGSWWWTGRPGVLRFMGSQRVGHDWATELNWTDVFILGCHCSIDLIVLITGKAFFFFKFIDPPPTSCGILVPQPGIKPMLSTVKVWSLNHGPVGNSLAF